MEKLRIHQDTGQDELGCIESISEEKLERYDVPQVIEYMVLIL